MQDIVQYYVEVSNLTSLKVRHFSLMNFLLTNFNVPKDIVFSIWSARDILRGQFEHLMSQVLPNSTIDMNAPVRIRLGLVHLETNRDFLQIPGSYPDEEDLEDEELIQQQHAQGVFDLHAIEEQKLRDSCWFNSSIKRQRVILKTKQNSPATVEANLQKLEYTQFPASIICPPRSPSYEPTAALSFYRKPIYVTGNYLKLQRGLSQTPWIVDGERKTEGSVEEFILEAFRRVYKAVGYKFHSAGREDVDVRMLFEGRPFVVEMEDAKRCDLSEQEYRNLQDSINNNTKSIQIIDLRPCSAAGFEEMKNAAEGKHKLYVAVIYTEDPITAEQLKKLDEIHDLPIKQRTPVRVLHRRSLLTRDKVVYGMKTTFVNSHHFILEIEASGGTYIKEFVHGDLGRTRPNIGEILVGEREGSEGKNIDCDILQLDVKAVVGVHIE
ncbi:uncharacterized protein [Blastocystis hominis]|uniref:tRNA pseudouridine(55) synthase n=1 Tax=Blastocystis hominis TaxID=12968 RepID=D8MBB2_BLAHO|nr:uncharacterized protein [Blastocystis hominis]CBK25351.2 unnamed protein product [Blastocystis hominis]|eukprot:XP_012899399.1 uncharacterized protein [Blastocystis hominis]